MKTLKDSHPSDMLLGKLGKRAGNIVMGILINGVVGDNHTFGVRQIYITKVKTQKLVNLLISLNINSSL